MNEDISYMTFEITFQSSLFQYNDMEGKRPASNFLLELSKGPKLKP